MRDVKEIITSARSISRLTATEMIHAICEGFVEFHGDRKFGDDPAIVGGIALLDDMPVTVIGTQKGHDVTENVYRNFGSPHPEGYRKGSPISYAAGLKGNLLLIHGTGDDNVHYQNCEMLVNELVRHGKIFSQISYPMRSHGIYEGKGTSLHLRKTMADYWLKNLPAGGK